jgi:ArsR family transcriptional regulator
MAEKETGMEDQQLKQITRVLKALSDENRIRMICLIWSRKDLCVCEITEIIGLAQPTISSHLKILENAGLIESYKNGLWVNYNISQDLDPFRSGLIVPLYKKLKKDKKIKSDLERIKNIDREMICRKKN